MNSDSKEFKGSIKRSNQQLNYVTFNLFNPFLILLNFNFNFTFFNLA